MLTCICCGSIHDVEAKYYADGEDAFDMRKNLSPKQATKRAPETATRKQPAMVSMAQPYEGGIDLLIDNVLSGLELRRIRMHAGKWRSGELSTARGSGYG